MLNIQKRRLAMCLKRAYLSKSIFIISNQSFHAAGKREHRRRKSNPVSRSLFVDQPTICEISVSNLYWMKGRHK